MASPIRTLWLLPTTVIAASLACSSGSNPTPAPAPTITSFAPSKASITAGESCSLTAVFSNGVGQIDPGAVAIASGTPVSLTPTTTTTYTLTVTGATGTLITGTTTVAVAPKPSLPVLAAPLMAVPETSTPATVEAQPGMTFTWTIADVNTGNAVNFDDSGETTTTGSNVRFTATGEGSFTLNCTASNTLGVTSQAASATVLLKKNFRAYVSDDCNNFFFKDITKMEAMQGCSSVGTTSLWSFPFYFVDKGRPDQNLPVMGAARYGNGRAILAGTGGVFWDASDAWGPGPNLKLFTNMVTWLTHGSAFPYAAATKDNPVPMLIVNTIDDPAWAPLPEINIKPVNVERFDATNLDPAKYPLVYANFWGVDEAQAEALVDFVKRGGAVYAETKGWVPTNYPWDYLKNKLGHDPRLSEYPLHQAMARMGLVLADQWYDIEESTTLPTASLWGCRARHTRWIMDSLKDVEDWNLLTTDIAECNSLDFNEALKALSNTISPVMKDLPKDDPWTKDLVNDINGRIASGQVQLKWPLSKTIPPYTIQGLSVLWSAATLDPSGTKSIAADHFPGKVDAGEPAVTRTCTVDFNIRDFSPLLLQPGPHAWNPTGLYAPAGSVVTLTVTPNGSGDMPELAVQVGCHTDQLWDKDAWERVPRVALSQQLKPGENRIVSPFGGLIYLIPQASAQKTASVQIQGAVEAPTFVLGQHTNADWTAAKSRQVPWAELRSHRMILTVPTSAIANLTDAESLMKKWDEIVATYDAFVGFKGDRDIHTAPDRPWQYVADIDISAGWMHSGCPIMYYQSEAAKILDVEYIMGHQEEKAWGFWHELGHDHQMSGFTFDQFGEVTENLFSQLIWAKYNNGMTRIGAEPSMWSGTQAYLARPIRNILTDEDFDSFEMVWIRLVMMWQLHLGLGDTFYPNLYRAYREMAAAGTGLDGSAPEMDRAQLFALTASQIAQKDLTSFFDAWGLPLTASTRSSIRALGYSEPTTPLWTIQPK